MPRTFTASTDRVEYTTNIAATTTMSWYGWVKGPSVSGTAAKMLACQEDQWRISFNAEKYGGGTATAGAIYFGRSWSTTDHVSEVASPGATWTNWNHVAVTYDGGATTNAAKIYLNGTLLTNSFTRNAAGTVDNATGNPNVGNDNAHTLCCLATIGWCGFHNVVLTAGEIQYAMRFGYYPRGAYVIWPLLGESTEPDYSGNRFSGTVTGTTVAGGGPPVSVPFFFQPTPEELTTPATTPVNTTRTALWNVQATVGGSRTALWNVQATVGSTKILVWNIRSTVGGTRIAVWNIRSTVGTTKILIWNLQATVGGTRILLWNLRAVVNTTKILIWNIYTTIGGSRTALWNISSTVGATRTALWNVIATVAATRTALWNVYMTVGGTRTALWNIATTVGTTRILVWNISITVGGSRTALWNVIATVAASRTALWNVRQTVAINSWASAVASRPGVISWMRFDETSGNFLDSVGSYQVVPNGSLTRGIAGLVPGDSNRAVRTRTDGTAQTGSNYSSGVAPTQGLTAVTVAISIKATGTPANWSDIVNCGWVGVGGLDLYESSSSLQLGVSDSTGAQKNASTSTIPRDGNTHRIVGTYDGATVKIYVDGVFKNSVAVASPAASLTSSGTFAILDTAAGVYYEADELIVANVAWDAATVAADYLASTAGNGRTLLWNINANVGASATALWNVQATVNASRTALWNISTTVAAQRSLLWNIATTVGTTRILIWNIRTTVGASSILVWNVRANVGATRSLIWNISTTIGATRTALWNLNAPVNATRTALWDVRAVVGTQDTLLWNVLNNSVVATQWSLLWDVRAAVGATRTALWNIYTTVGGSRILLWDVRAAVGSTRTALWNVRSAVGASATALWNIYITVNTSGLITTRNWEDGFIIFTSGSNSTRVNSTDFARSGTHSLKVTCPGGSIDCYATWSTSNGFPALGPNENVEWSIWVYSPTNTFLDLSGCYIQENATPFRKIALAGATRVAISAGVWTQIGGSGVTASDWATSSRLVIRPPSVSSSAAQPYDTIPLYYDDAKLQEINTGRLLWNISSNIGATRTALWNVQSVIGATRTALWNIYTPTALTRTLLWGIRVPVPTSRTILWDLLQRVGTSRTALWDITAAAAASRTALWNVRELVGLDANLLWEVDELVGIDTTLLWSITDPVAIQQTLLWSIAQYAAVQRILRWSIEFGVTPVWIIRNAPDVVEIGRVSRTTEISLSPKDDLTIRTKSELPGMIRTNPRRG